MIIKRIRAINYKTYLNLDLDLSVERERPIILIGGNNGGGKTTLFEAISGALYGLRIKNKQHFYELLNNGAFNQVEHKIELELTFVGLVLGMEQKYVLKRTYMLNPSEKPVESVSLNMNGNMFVYGTATPPAQRAKSEQQVNKIIKANLPQELSQYFLFDEQIAGRKRVRPNHTRQHRECDGFQQIHPVEKGFGKAVAGMDRAAHERTKGDRRI